MTSSVQISRSDAVATLTLDRPGKMNALNLAMWQALGDAIKKLDADEGLRCVVLRGSGGHFAAGADLVEFSRERADPGQAEAYGKLMLAALFGLRDLRHPSVAVIEGNCLGAGLELAAMCDLRLATSDAKFGVPIQRVGITMPYPELASFVAMMGRPAVLEMLLEGAIHDTEWAQRHNLVTRVVEVDALDEALAVLVGRIVAGSPVSHRNHKRFSRRCLDPRPLTEAEIREGYDAVSSADYREGLAAFLARRRPQFTGL